MRAVRVDGDGCEISDWPGNGFRFFSVDWLNYVCDKPITLLGQGLDVSGIQCGVAQRLPNMPNAVVQSLIELDKGRAVPNVAAQVFAGNRLARPFNEKL